MKASLRRTIWQLAGAACEYCRLPQAYDPLPFRIDHIIADQHGGRTVLRNLAPLLPVLQQHKGPNIAGIDPRSRRMVRLFHPRRDHWNRHFRWQGPMLVGRTAIGRATIVVLAINDIQNVGLRAALIENGEFPPR